MLIPNVAVPAGGRRPRLQPWHLGVAGLGLGGLYLLGFWLGGEIAAGLAAGLTVLPFTALALLAYLGEGRRWARVGAVLALLALAAGFAFAALALSYLSVAGPVAGGSRGLAHLLSAGRQVPLLRLLAGLTLAGGLGAAGFLPGVRRQVARVLPLDPESFVHMIALVAVVTLAAMGVVPLIVLGGPPLLGVVAHLGANDPALAGGRSAAGQLRDSVYSLLWTIPGAILAVGYGVRRTLPAALVRLGLVWPTRRQVLGACGLAGVVVFAAAGLDQVIGGVWATMGWAPTDQQVFGALLAYATSPVGALVVGVTAGLGEEVAVRGVLQPRLGIFLSNLLFTSLHAFQYSWDALLSVFLLGLIMGLIRQRTNTTTSAIVHGTYDFLLILATVLHLG